MNKDEEFIDNFLNQPYEWCVDYISKNPKRFKNIKEQTSELCCIAYSLDYMNGKYIHEPFRKDEKVLAIARLHSFSNKEVPSDFLEKIEEYPYDYFEKKFPEIFF